MSQFISIPSPVESLTSGTAGVWDILRYPELDQELAIRSRLRSCLDNITGPVDWSSDASDELYQLLDRLLSYGHDRFVLYCPFELIPTAESYRQYSQSLDDFAESYLRSWYRLLNIQDVRANFIDGDVPDIELEDRPMPMVVQAAYLAPMLVQRGLLTPQQAESIGQVNNNHHQHTESITEKRAKWLELDKHRRAIKEAGQRSAPWLIRGEVPGDDDIFISAFSAALGSLRHDKVAARLLFEQHRNRLSNIDNYDGICSLLCKAYHAGIITRDIIDESGVFVPFLAGPFYRNLGRLTVISPLDDVIYPVSIVYGSRLKGYGDRNSDIDRAVFVRPGVDYEKAYKVLASHDVTAFWLDEAGEYLRIRDFDKPEAWVGNSTDAHVLFGGVWEGDNETIEMLCRRLLVPYRNNENRGLMLFEMERDLLLYRLLHRGYEKYYYTDGPTFFDAGYRLIAARIFASHVFVP